MICGWGCSGSRRHRLDIADWGRNLVAAEFGRYGTLHVRYGMDKRGQQPRRGTVTPVMA